MGFGHSNLLPAFSCQLAANTDCLRHEDAQTRHDVGAHSLVKRTLMTMFDRSVPGIVVFIRVLHGTVKKTAGFTPMSDEYLMKPDVFVSNLSPFAPNLYVFVKLP
jgi:hypothetical protein